MQWKPIDIEDRELFEHYFNAEDFRVSDFSFTNLYLWHFSRSISYTLIDELLCIKTQYPNEQPFLFYPFGDKKKKEVIGNLMDNFASLDVPFSFRSLNTEMVKELEQLFPQRFEFIHNRERCDYVYSVGELIELKGRKFHKKKNHLNRFFELYPSFTYEALDDDNCHELLQVWESWFQKIAHSADVGLHNEYVGIVETLKQFKRMSYQGGILRIGGEIVAFTLGEQLDSDTVVIHIEKANTEYHGAYQAINQQFLLNQWKHLTFVNREEDLGIEGLRRAKLSYQPTHLIDKYTAILK